MASDYLFHRSGARWAPWLVTQTGPPPDSGASAPAPPVAPSWPDRAQGALRAAVAAYVALLSPTPADQGAAAAPPVAASAPDRAVPPRRAARSAYAGLVSPTPPDSGAAGTTFTIVGSAGASMSAATGRSTEGHAQWAVNQGAYWVFYLSSTQSLSAKYSTDGGATWTAPTGSPFALAVAHGSEGRDYAFSVASVAGVDVLHAQSRAYHSRFTLGTTWTNTNAESAAGFGDPNSLGSAVAYDGSAVPFVAGPYAGSASAAAWKGSNADAGTSWTAGFGTKAYFNDVTFWSSSFALAPLASDMLLLADLPATATTFTNIEWNVYSTATAGTAATALAAPVTAADTDAWGAVGRTTSDVHLVALSDNSNSYVHRRFNGTSWSNGDTIPTLAYGTTSGVSLVTDGTSVWAAVVDVNNNVQWSRWASGPGWSGWSTLAAHGSNARSYITGTYSPARNEILWAWTENTGANFDIAGAVLSTGAPAVGAPAVAPAVPDAAPRARRAAVAAYALLPSTPPDAGVVAVAPPVAPSAPDRAIPPRRAARSAYAALASATPPDAGIVLAPPVAAALPVQAMARRRAGWYPSAVPSPPDAGVVPVPPAVAPSWPHLSRGAARAADVAYAGLLSPTPPDAGVVGRLVSYVDPTAFSLLDTPSLDSGVDPTRFTLAEPPATSQAPAAATTLLRWPMYATADGSPSTATPTVALFAPGSAWLTPAEAPSYEGDATWALAAQAAEVAGGTPLLLYASATAADPAPATYWTGAGAGWVHGVAALPFPVWLPSSVDGSPVAGATPTVLVSPNGAPFAAAAGSLVEPGGAGAGNGFYLYYAAIAEVAAPGSLVLWVTAPAAVSQWIEYILQ